MIAGGLQALTGADLDNDPPIVSRTLPNGLQVVVFRDNTVPLATVELAIRMGSVYETAADNGIAHLYEHMFFRSNRAQVTQEAYLTDIGIKGISYNGMTSEERSSFYLTGLSGDLDTMIHCLRDAALYPVFDPAEVRNEIEVVRSENERIDANPYSQLQARGTALLFPANPTFKMPNGLESVLRSATSAQLRAMHERMVQPANAVLVVTGNCDPAEVFQRAADYFGPWTRSTSANPPAPAPGPGPTRAVADVLEVPNIENPVVIFMWRGPSVDSDPGATYAADVLSYVLRQPGSRFQTALVDSGLAIGVNLGYLTQRHIGVINFTVQTTPDKAREAVQVLREQLGKILSPGYFTDQEVENAKAALAAGDLFDREKPSEYAHTIAFWAISSSIPYLLGQQQAYRGTNREDIARYLRRYILGQPGAAVAVVGSGGRGKVLTADDLIKP